MPVPLGTLCETLVPAATHIIRDRQAMTKLLHEHLAQAQNRMKQQADFNRTERSFEVGDWVYLY